MADIKLWSLKRFRSQITQSSATLRKTATWFLLSKILWKLSECFCKIVLANKQTNQTKWKHNLLGRSNNWQLQFHKTVYGLTEKSKKNSWGISNTLAGKQMHGQLFLAHPVVVSYGNTHRRQQIPYSRRICGQHSQNCGMIHQTEILQLLLEMGKR